MAARDAAHAAITATARSPRLATSLAPGYGGSLDGGVMINDGDLDLLLTGYWHVMQRLYRNDGKRRFHRGPIAAIPIIRLCSLGWIMIDGYPEILLKRW